MSRHALSIPADSAVLLLHNKHGGFPIARPSGAMTRQTAHTLDYDGRKGEFEEREGCDREPTARDHDLAEIRIADFTATGQNGNGMDGVRQRGAANMGIATADMLDRPTRGRGATDNAMQDEAMSHLDYVARTGKWEGGKHRDLTEGYVPSPADPAQSNGATQDDCSYWGQCGPLTREEIEHDMLACGGCYLKSVVSVDRRYASALGLDSKAAFQELIRNNWQEMMVAAGVAERHQDVHWYACYHTDAENSLHVHIGTWAADGRVQEGWHPSARDTRVQKAMLYRDALAPIRMQRDYEHDYYRMLLPRLAAVEMGDFTTARSIESLHEKAQRAGVCEIPLKRTLDAHGMADVDRASDAVTRRLQAGEGLKARDWKLQSDAGKAVEAIRRASPTFEAALTRYRQLAEVKADLAGLAVAKTASGNGGARLTEAEREREASAREVTQHERDRFIRREMDDMMRRIRNQVIRSADPDARMRELAREEVDRLRAKLVTESLHPDAIGLPPQAAARLREIFQDAARNKIGERSPDNVQSARPSRDDAGFARSDGTPHSLQSNSSRYGENGETPNRRHESPITNYETISTSRADEAARIIASSLRADIAVRDAAGRIALETRGAVSETEAERALRAELVPRLANAVKWRFDQGHVNPRFIGHDRLSALQERALSREMVTRAVSSDGLSLGMSRADGETLSHHIRAARCLHALPQEHSDSSIRDHVHEAARMITSSPVMRAQLDWAISRNSDFNSGGRPLDRAYVTLSAEYAVERQVMAYVTQQSQAAEHQAPSMPPALDVAGFAAQVIASMIRDRSSESSSSRAARTRGARDAKPLSLEHVEARSR